MHRTLPWLLLLSFGMTGCASQGQPSEKRSAQAIDASVSHHEQLAKEATPAAWHPGAKWSFVSTNKDGGIENAFVFEVTDRVAITCSSGDWKQLEIVAGDRDRLSHPAYLLNGRNLLLLLSTALCDAEPGFRGELSDTGFTGRDEFSHLLGTETYGKVYGVPVDATPDDRKPELTQNELALGAINLGLSYTGVVS